MRDYMPALHRQFLTFLESKSNIHGFIPHHQDQVKLRTIYIRCIDILVALRGKHMEVVSRYILSQVPRKQVENDTSLAIHGMSGLRGTGGTTFVPLLKRTKNHTKEASYRLARL